jgi:hypothetical protein
MLDAASPTNLSFPWKETKQLQAHMVKIELSFKRGRVIRVFAVRVLI